MRRAWRAMAAVGVLLAACAVLLSVLLFVQGQDLRLDAQRETRVQQERRAADQTRVDRLLCEAQEVTVERAIDQKRNSIAIARSMRGLLLRVRRTSDSAETRGQLLHTARRLSVVIGRLKRGRRVLQRELDAVDCAHLQR